MAFLKIGDLAKAAGISVRSLHHYDSIGLLTPTGERESGHRMYSCKDVDKLGQIIALKSMGLPLKNIAEVLSQNAYDLRTTLAMQADALNAQMESLKKATHLLQMLIDKLDSNQCVTTEELLSFIKEIQFMEKVFEKYYTPEQMKKLQERYEKYPDKVKEVQNAWPVLFKKFEEAMKSGLPVHDLKVQVLAKEAELYIDLFTGGDKSIQESLEKYNRENLDSALKMWGISKEVYEYMEGARKNLSKIIQK